MLKEGLSIAAASIRSLLHWKEKSVSKPQILIVEDEGIVAIDLQERVIKMGFEAPRISHTADDAVIQAIALRPSLVLMDIRLNGTIDGIVAAETIRSSLGIPVVFLTAFADEILTQETRMRIMNWQRRLRRWPLGEPVGRRRFLSRERAFLKSGARVANWRATCCAVTRAN